MFSGLPCKIRAGCASGMQATVEGLLEWRVGTFEQWLAQPLSGSPNLLVARPTAPLARRPRLPGIARAKVGILPRKKISKLSSKPTVSANLPGIAQPARHSPRQGRDSSQEKISKLSSKPTVSANLPGIAQPARHTRKK